MRQAAAVLLLVGCAGCPGAGHYDRKYPAPQGADLVAAVRARQAKVKSLRAKAVADHMQGKQRVKGDIDILLARPASLHFRAVDPSGAVASMLTSDGQQFALLDVQNNRFLVGDATPCNLARLAEIALDGASIIDLLTGGAPVPDGPVAVAWDAKAGAEVVTITVPDGREVIHLDGRGEHPSWDVTEAEKLDPKGKTVWRTSATSAASACPRRPSSSSRPGAPTCC